MVKNRKRISLVILPLLAVLILAVILILAGGNQEDGEETVPSSTAAETAPPPVTPEAAAANLSEAHAFQLTVSMLNSADSYSYENAYRFQMAKTASGTQAILFSQLTTMVAGGETIESVGDQAYYQGNIAYIKSAYGPSPITTMWSTDKAYDLASVVEEQSGLPIHAVGKSMVAAFSALDPVLISTQDGSTSYMLQNLTADQYATIYSTFAGESATNELLQSAGKNCMFNVRTDIDAQGFLSQFKLEMLNVSSSEGSQNITIRFSIDQINASDTIAVPDYAANFSLANGDQVVYSQGAQNAYYYYNAVSSNSESPVSGLVFGGFGSSIADDYVIEYYEVLSQINGTPVAEVQQILNNTLSSIAVKRLVIPTGVKVNIRGTYTGNSFASHTKDTILFFNDKEEDVEKTFLVEGETTGNKEAVFFKAAYYAGQWEYVDGIPTPKN